MSTDRNLVWVHPDREEKGAQEGLLEPGNVEWDDSHAGVSSVFSD